MKILLLGALLFYAAILSAAPIIPVRTCGSVLDVPDGRYKLVSNLECTGGTAIIITANNVRFDLSHRTISGPGGTAIGIRVDFANGVLVVGGQINKFGTGISVDSAIGTIIRKVSLLDCDTGIRLSASQQSIAERNTITSSSDTGIVVFPDDVLKPNNVRISNNTIINPARGIFLLTANGTQINDNIISGATETGIYLIESVGVTVQENVITRSTFTGILLQDSNGAQVLNNISNDNGRGIKLGNNLAEPPNDNNTIHGNITNGNSDIGIFIVIGTGNDIQGNISLENVTSDMSDNFTCMNTWTKNTFVTDSEGDGPGAGCIQ